MRYLTPILALLVALTACYHHSPGWAKQDAQDFATKLGYPNAFVACHEHTIDEYAVCAVKIENQWYVITCYEGSPDYCEPNRSRW